MGNVGPPVNSTLPKEAMDAYATFGSFIRKCYGEGNVSAASSLASRTCTKNCMNVNVELDGTHVLDRIVLKEDLSMGQMVTSFRILADGTEVFSGSSIGRSLIAFLKGP